jgi:hypothetical protein
MHTTAEDVHTLDELRQFIHKTLCAKENLLVHQFRMTEVRLTRGNVPCGLQFCLRGPRNVRLAAIWVADQNMVYLYDARGERYAKLRLTTRLALLEETRAA